MIVNHGKGITVPVAKSEANWSERTRAYLKSKVRSADMTYGELAEKMEKLGFEETAASVANKLMRGTFSATFFLAALTAIGCKTIRLEDI